MNPTKETSGAVDIVQWKLWVVFKWICKFWGTVIIITVVNLK